MGRTVSELNNSLVFDFTVNHHVKTIWNMWTNEEGLKKSFSPNLSCDFRVNGKFEIYFDMDAPMGSRGSEGMQILAIEPQEMLSFTWNQPPVFSAIRGQQTFVQLQLVPLGLEHEKTRVVFSNTGYGYGDEWQKAREYFRHAWGDIVLARFRYVLKNGTYDWQKRPSVAGYSVINRGEGAV
jgi:uncharacterized protein YndB with AHSA1/START domain